MKRHHHAPQLRTPRLTWCGFASLSLLAVQILFITPAFACGNAMRMVTPGVMFWLVVAWLVAGTISAVFVFVENRRANPLSIKHRRLAILAIFAALTAARLIHYGATVDVEDWRLFDWMVSEFPQRFGTEPVHVTF